MQISHAEQLRMERAHVLAWPVLLTGKVDGWLWRCSGGGSQRANSVSTIDYSGSDMAASVREVEARYRAHDSPARFQTYDKLSPAALTDMLRARGYQEAEATSTMFKRIEDRDVTAEVEQRDHAWDEWRAVYLGEITPNRRAVNTQILDRVPGPRAFFGYRLNGRIVSTALCAVGFGCAVVECVATQAASRRQGASYAIMTALEAWAARQPADLIGLQVVTTNAAALALYRRLGFVACVTNRFWVAERQ